MNIVIPMAGLGSRFLQAGYKKPKPLIDVCGKSMIERVLDNFSTVSNKKFILIVRKEHIENNKSFFEELVKKYTCNIITVDKITEGAACTILKAVGFINNEEELLLANSDQVVDMKINDFTDDCRKRGLDGSILTFYAQHAKWSYARVNENGLLVESKEKKVISSHATVGIYFFRKGRYFVNSAVEMIANNDRVKNEFYTAPAYNYSIKNGLKIGIYEIDKLKMFGLGTPEDLENYKKLKFDSINPKR